MRTFTFAQLKQRSREKADMVNSQFVDNLELENLVNESLTDLYDILVTTLGADYYVKDESFPTISGQSEYLLPSDFYKMAGVDLGSGSGKPLTVKPFMFQERNRYNNALIYDASTDGVLRARYRIIGENIKFVPDVLPSGTITLWYHPACPILSSDTDTFDGINGYEEMVILLTAIKMLQKEESDTVALERRYEALKQRVVESAANRDSGFPEQVQDTRRDTWGDNYFGDL